MLVLCLTAGTVAAAEKAGKKRFCLILPHGTYGDIPLKAVAPVVDKDSVESGNEEGQLSFFKGAVRKIGIGVPRCFRILAEGGALALNASEVLSYDDRFEEGGKKGMRGTLFPSLGFFTRTSRDNKVGVALGVGLKSSIDEHGEPLAENPETGAALRIAFGF